MDSPSSSILSYGDEQLARRFDEIAIDLRQIAAALNKRNHKLARSKVMSFVGLLSIIVA